MTGDTAATAEEAFDIERLHDWLANEVDPSLGPLTVTKLGGGHSGGAWRVDSTLADASVSFVLKAPPVTGGMVFQADPCREARIMDAARRLGAPVPRIIAVDHGARVIGRPCFILEHVAGRSVADTTPDGYHGTGWFRDHSSDTQRLIWESFVDALGTLHKVDPSEFAESENLPRGCGAAIEYWRSSLLDAADAETVARQLAVLDWLQANIPVDADAAPAICMGDARLVNALVNGDSVQALVDFEVAYIGNPAADIGYGLFLDEMHRQNSDEPLPGVPSPEETWQRWSQRTGRPVSDCNYWTAFGVMVLCITATRAMVQWGLAGPSLEDTNPIVAEWELMTTRASRHIHA
ncbi:phosphotransferase family protein [Mycobacterium sp. WUMAC-067]|uniref:phosphotransferase family protein n=1 Tax=unclassified Mycobacterium TaxID=2642494 RepID=UPI001CD92A82|nr:MULTISPECIES: phosphotransferase family protein [unclassified Mycobacterium]MCA2244767.1 phosphotransferase family protein [Mycobacterium sp. WUMAC-067]MCA2315977.1 phosphotransferase family protein [Mycobacterium sp. WUMAC-025]